MQPQPLDIHLPSVRLAALDYRTACTNPSATPVVLLHGQADLAWAMHPVALALASRYRVVSVDLRGHGDSDHPGAYSMLHFVADLKGVIGYLGFERPIIIGHSLGGQIASQFSGLYPDLVRALVLAEGIGPPLAGHEGGDSDPDTARMLVERVSAPTARRPLVDVDAAAARLLATHPGLSPDVAALLASEGTRATPDGGVVWKFDTRTQHWFASLARATSESRWQMVRCPTLVITGEIAWERWWSKLDFAAAAGASGPDHDEIARRVACFNDVRHVELAAAGHMLQYDRPEALNAVIAEFLGSLN